jgi:hypothetical protein
VFSTGIMSASSRLIEQHREQSGRCRTNFSKLASYGRDVCGSIVEIHASGPMDRMWRILCRSPQLKSAFGPVSRPLSSKASKASSTITRCATSRG